MDVRRQQHASTSRHCVAFLAPRPPRFLGFFPIALGRGKTHCTRFPFDSFLVPLAFAALKFRAFFPSGKKFIRICFPLLCSQQKLFPWCSSHSFPSIPSAYVCIKYAAKIIKIHTHIYIHKENLNCLSVCVCSSVCDSFPAWLLLLFLFGCFSFPLKVICPQQICAACAPFNLFLVYL